MQGEKQSADVVLATTFINDFPNMIEGYSMGQTLNWSLLSYTSTEDSSKYFEKSADGREKTKDHITVNASANVTGSIKVPIIFIGKAAHPR